jgi:hypothetical protein
MYILEQNRKYHDTGRLVARRLVYLNIKKCSIRGN